MSGRPKQLAAALRVASRSGRGVSSPWRQPPPAHLIEGADVSGYDKIRVWGDEVSKPLLEAIARKDEDIRAAAEAGRSPKSLCQASYLAISGGGDQGAFAAGVLSGWSARGDRPDFEVVTGVSAGALAAPFAFVGPCCDGLLRDVYTKLGGADLYRSRGLRGYFTDAFVDTALLKRVIDSYATDRFLDRIAEGFRDGRRLYVLTTNLDAQRPMVWDLSAVAAAGRPDRREMFTRIMLASSAVPGLFPPVYFQVVAPDGRSYTEMHVDGGVTAQLVFAPPDLRDLEIEDRIFERRRTRDLYVIRNSKIAPDYEATAPRALPIGARAIRTMVKYQVIADLARVFKFARSNGTSFRYCAIPASLDVGGRSPFHKELSRELFASGEQVGLHGHWSSKPPPSPSAAGLEESGASREQRHRGIPGRRSVCARRTKPEKSDVRRSTARSAAEESHSDRFAPSARSRRDNRR